MSRTLQIALAAAAFALWCGSAVPINAANFTVIVHSTNSASSMSSQDLSKLFLKKTKKWADGRPATPVDLPEDSATRESFSQSVHGKSVSSIKAYWQRLVFSGRAVPPPERASVQAIVDFVETNPGAVGYVPSGAAIGDCKALLVH